MKYAITITAVLSLAHTGTAACVSGTYRCAQKSGLAAQFLQCANGSEISMMCGPGTVCYSQGNSIMCGFPVDTASEPAADKGLVAGAQCQALSPWDEYMCPGESGVHAYFLRCVSGNYIHFSCPPGTVCIKSKGSSMYCGWKGDGGALAESSAVASQPAESTLSGSTSAGATPVETTPAETTPAETTPSETTPVETTPVETTPAETTSAEISLSDTANSSSTSDPFGTLFPPATSDTALPSYSETTGATPDLSSNLTSDILSPTVSAAEPTDLTTTEPAASPAPTDDTLAKKFGLSGQLISQGLQMVLANGIPLPMPLPNIELPEINLASVHLPDVTLQGIAVTGLHLPTITIPPLNPASLTNFAYIEGILSKAHMSFDDIANLPLPDLESISLPNMGNLNIGNLMGMMGGGGLGNVVRNDSTAEPQTTTLGQDEIINAIGISMITNALNH